MSGSVSRIALFLVLAGLPGCVPDPAQVAQRYCAAHGYDGDPDCLRVVAARERQRQIAIISGMTDDLNASSANMRAATMPAYRPRLSAPPNPPTPANAPSFAPVTIPAGGPQPHGCVGVVPTLAYNTMSCP